MKKIIFLISIITILLFSGCQLSEIKEKIPGIPKTTTGGKEYFSGGTEGITSEITIPSEDGKVYTSQPFKVEVMINNEGEFGDEESPAEGTTCVFGLNRKYFPSFPGCDCQDFSLKGKRKVGKEIIEGEEEVLVFEGGEIQAGELKEFAGTAKTRYDYKTYGIIKSCIKKDPYSEKGCKTSSKTNILKSKSSAPVTIKKVTQDIIGIDDETVELRLNIEIEESGDGDVYDLDQDKDKCESPADMKKRINVKLSNAPGRASCDQTELKTETGLLSSKDESTAHCTVKNIRVSDEGYEAEMTIILEYAYETIDSNKFEVVE